MSSSSKLQDFSTCEISDALIKLAVPNGGYIPDISMVSPTTTESSVRICGPAYTVKMVLGSNTTAPKLSAHFVDTAPADHIIVIDAPPEAKNAVWGGLMTAGAQANGALGVVISGRCRDLSEHRSLGFPVFSRGHSTLGQSPFTRPSEINIPLEIKSQGAGSESFPHVTVQPGDWIVADQDGVVCVPVALESQVLELTSKGRGIDEKCMQDIKAGKGVQNSFKLHRGK
ncbi:ribonuclease E inhibitor RraA/Dimethylmenaquinone methyltransferase [Panaeolus papilionaceus]|nr:ribonuclease E inhibitor RraA/Dimethylmenaquinone methyltransferase [Panaeolus papilionaceus]